MDFGTYELKYKIDKMEISMKFDGEITLSTLKDNLKYFLLSCSWLPNQVDELFGDITDET